MGDSKRITRAAGAWLLSAALACAMAPVVPGAPYAYAAEAATAKEAAAGQSASANTADAAQNAEEGSGQSPASSGSSAGSSASGNGGNSSGASGGNGSASGGNNASSSDQSGTKGQPNASGSASGSSSGPSSSPSSPSSGSSSGSVGKAPSASAGAGTQKPEADKKAEEEKRKAEEAKKAATASAGWTAANGKDSYTLPGKNGSLESKDGARVVKVSGVKRLGVDVSSHNGTIDWKRAKAAGVEFAIIRCGSFNKTTGLHGVDKQFVRNVQGAREAGIPVGVYLYSYAKTVKGETWSAQAEARNVLSFLEKAGVTPADMALPVYYDLEDAGQALLPAQTLGEMATEFCNTLSEAGYRTGIYANKQWWGSRLTDAAFDNPTWHVWAARYPSKGALTGSGVDGAQIWQFSERGKVDGIPGSVDMNFDFGVSEQEMRLAASTVDPNRQVAYAAYVQGTGWQSWAADGMTAGTSGQKLRMEAFSLRLSHETLEEAAQAAVEKAKAALPEGVAVSNTVIVSGDASASDGEEGSNAVDAPVAPDVAQVAESMPLASAFAKQHDVVPGLPAIEYRACVEGHGWQEWRSNGQTAGTTGQSKRIEALEIRLSGSVTDVYDVRYRAQVEKDGWTEWAENGQTVGSEGLDRRIEAFEVQLTPKTA